MNHKYQRWVDNQVGPYTRGMCGKCTEQMTQRFPELKRCSGWAIDACGQMYEHYWCETEDGEIVDPTVSQFLFKIVTYRYFVPGDVIKVGKCLECGQHIFGKVQDPRDPQPELVGGARSMTVCSDECLKALVAETMPS